jgi:hypothetical protein
VCLWGLESWHAWLGRKHGCDLAVLGLGRLFPCKFCLSLLLSGNSFRCSKFCLSSLLLGKLFGCLLIIKTTASCRLSARGLSIISVAGSSVLGALAGSHQVRGVSLASRVRACGLSHRSGWGSVHRKRGGSLPHGKVVWHNNTNIDISALIVVRSTQVELDVFIDTELDVIVVEVI